LEKEKLLAVNCIFWILLFVTAMPGSDAPALNDDGTLKDATELEWLNSPSDESCPITLVDHKKRKRPDNSAQW
jgi:hypothetical protein